MVHSKNEFESLDSEIELIRSIHFSFTSVRRICRNVAFATPAAPMKQAKIRIQNSKVFGWQMLQSPNFYNSYIDACGMWNVNKIRFSSSKLNLNDEPFNVSTQSN